MCTSLGTRNVKGIYIWIICMPFYSYQINPKAFNLPHYHKQYKTIEAVGVSNYWIAASFREPWSTCKCQILKVAGCGNLKSDYNNFLIWCHSSHILSYYGFKPMYFFPIMMVNLNTTIILFFQHNYDSQHQCWSCDNQ